MQRLWIQGIQLNVAQNTRRSAWKEVSFSGWQRKPSNELAAFAASDTDHCVGPPQPWQRVSVKACVAFSATAANREATKASREHSSCNCNLGGWLHHTHVLQEGRRIIACNLSNIGSWFLAKRLSLPSREILCFGTRKQLPTSLCLWLTLLCC